MLTLNVHDGDAGADDGQNAAEQPPAIGEQQRSDDGATDGRRPRQGQRPGEHRQRRACVSSGGG